MTPRRQPHAFLPPDFSPPPRSTGPSPDASLPFGPGSLFGPHPTWAPYSATSPFQAANEGLKL